MLLDNGTPYWSVVNFINLSFLHCENHTNGVPDNKTQARKCGLILNTRRYAMANSNSGMHFCAMFGHELSAQVLIEQVQWFTEPGGYLQTHYPALVCPFDSESLVVGNYKFRACILA